MAETFPREFAADPEPFTGERLTASIHGQVEIEHYHRYLFCRGFCRDRDVLDVASGEVMAPRSCRKWRISWSALSTPVRPR